MAINGAMAAGMQGDYSILISKSVIDGVTAVTFAAAMGVGVAFSAIPILVYEMCIRDRLPPEAESADKGKEKPAAEKEKEKTPDKGKEKNHE